MPRLLNRIATWLFGGSRNVARRARIVRARYDAATTTPDNRRHWAAADGLSARAANSPEVRRVLRNRARYEVANNSYARGIVTTLAHDCIGTGPRLQVQHDLARELERQFAGWAKAVGLAEKLRVMRMAVAQDGEAFALLVSNPMVSHNVKLDIQLIEADQVATPGLVPPQQPNATDGIEFDRWGNPTAYLVLDAHPGDPDFAAVATAKRVPAASMIHLFVPERAGQLRGVPEMTAALPLFAQLRRYTLAVIAAAETAADFSAVLFTDAPADGDVSEGEPFESLEIEKRTMVTLPAGYKLEQLRAEQPSTTYAEFKREILNEIARCLNMPYNIAACNSSGYNYASGRLDHQTYYKSIRVWRNRLETTVLDRIFATWLDEAALTVLPGPVGEDVPHQWFWDGFEHVDPAKEANAQATRLANNTTTLAYEYARQGRDWEEELRQRARELALMRELGIDTAGAITPITDTTDEDEYATQTDAN